MIDFLYEQLSRVPCPTVIIAGNHDCWEERSVLQRMDFRHAGHHVTLLDEIEGTQVTFPELLAPVRRIVSPAALSAADHRLVQLIQA